VAGKVVNVDLQKIIKAVFSKKLASIFWRQNLVKRGFVDFSDERERVDKKSSIFQFSGTSFLFFPSNVYQSLKIKKITVAGRL
jgi:hypothetical protein